MTRIPRKYGNSKTYHIIFKGIDNQDIFYDDLDKRNFLKNIIESKKEFAYNVYAYCLMDNHIHMVIKSEKEFLSKAMQSLMVRYAHYFNKKYKRTGPLIQNRFKSMNIEDQGYFLRVCRYVHRNPENAGIAKTEDYEWSSYKEYVGKAKIIDKNVLLHYLEDDIQQFISYTATNNNYEDLEDFAEYEIMGNLKDKDVINIIMKIFNISDISEISTFFKNLTAEELQKNIINLKRIKGINKTQVARITRISRWIIEKIW